MLLSISKRLFSTRLQVWSEEIRPNLEQVSSIVSDAIKNVSALSPQEKFWLAATDAVKHIDQSPSKHLLRPQLIILGSSASSLLGRNKRLDRGINRFAAGSELLHIHLLCLDDIREHAHIRRGLPTLPISLSNAGVENHETRTHLSTIIGEILHAKAYELMIKGAMTISEEVKATHEEQRGILMANEITMKASIIAAQARFSDALGWRTVEPRWKKCVNDGQKEKLRQDILYDKGGYHRMTAPLEAGLRLGGAEESLIAISKKWGLHLGVALEGLDHLNVLTSDPMKTGKDSLQDIRAGRLVLPLFLIRENVNETEWEEIEDILQKSDSKFTCNPAVSVGERATLIQVIDKYKIEEKCYNFVKREIQTALHIIDNELSDALPETSLLRNGLKRFTVGLLAHAKELRKNQI